MKCPACDNEDDADFSEAPRMKEVLTEWEKLVAHWMDCHDLFGPVDRPGTLRCPCGFETKGEPDGGHAGWWITKMAAHVRKHTDDEIKAMLLLAHLSH